MEAITLKGFFRLQIVDPDGTIKGDSGLCKNMITNLGFNKYVAGVLAGSNNTLTLGSVALGSGAAPASNATVLPGEIGVRTSFSGSTSGATAACSTNSSHYAALYATFGAGWHTSVGAGYDISNIGLYNGTASDGTLFAGNTYASSACASNQAVNISYYLSFTTA
jgi:hypothetical protein